MVDLLLEGGSILTMDDCQTVIHEGAVAVDNGKIKDVGDRSRILNSYGSDRIINTENKIILPGLISAHVHVSDIFVRGTAAGHDRPLSDWVNNIQRPGVMAMKPEEHKLAAELYCREALQSGITTFVENALGSGASFSDDAIEMKLDSYLSSGIRAVFGFGFMDKKPEQSDINKIQSISEPCIDSPPVAWLETDKALCIIENYIKKYNKKFDRLDIWPAPMALRRMSDDGLRRSYQLAEKYDCMTTMHVAETLWGDGENNEAIKHLDEVGYLGPKTLLGHCVHVSDEDIDRLASTDTKIAHNLATNQVLGSGIAPVPKFRKQEITTALGTDDTSANDTVDLLRDARLMTLAHKGHWQDSTAISGVEAMQMMTSEAAHAIGKSDELGSLEPQKRADIVIIDTEAPHLRPIPDIITALVYRACGSDVETVICDGKIVVEKNSVKTLPEWDDNRVSKIENATAAVRKRVGIDKLI